MIKENDLKTPKKGIKIGEWSKTESGIPALTVKKPKSNVYETVPVPKLMRILSSKLDDESKADSPKK